MQKELENRENLIAPPAIKVRVERGQARDQEALFRAAFRIGRDASCELQINDHAVSRIHAEVVFEEGCWWIRDLGSTNGTFIHDTRIERAPLPDYARIGLGATGPILRLEVENSTTQQLTLQQQNPSLTRYIQRYFDGSLSGPAGEHTMMVRRAFQRVQKKKSRKYWAIITGVSALCLSAVAFAVYKHQQLIKQQSLAQDLFYEMKELDLTLSQLEKAVTDPRGLAEIAKYRERRKELEKSYNRYLDELGLYHEKMSADERIIFRLARLWGECEINMPKGFVAEVRRYIGLWKTTRRLQSALARSAQNGYAAKIAEALLAQGLPPQFFYLALQESDFDINKCGPETRYGIAKGMWQFIPGTAEHYGLRVGFLKHLRKPDPNDERHHFEKSTQAAAKYLRYIYDTDAQASGLLVMASYNWGENNVLAQIRKMPANPRERNFWHLLETEGANLPRQTYDFVFYIFSAAVIGENPGLFGFTFDNPLARLEQNLVSQP